MHDAMDTGDPAVREIPQKHLPNRGQTRSIARCLSGDAVGAHAVTHDPSLGAGEARQPGTCSQTRPIARSRRREAEQASAVTHQPSLGRGRPVLGSGTPLRMTAEGLWRSSAPRARGRLPPQAQQTRCDGSTIDNQSSAVSGSRSARFRTAAATCSLACERSGRGGMSSAPAGAVSHQPLARRNWQLQCSGRKARGFLATIDVQVRGIVYREPATVTVNAARGAGYTRCMACSTDL
ncbi:hypothetical protein NDU88_011778 [Pleurodeles waltl]|uniref:Uncharacterized protein n=1 Tax=Pleurodeles waltl TaxID=8319 RepID=A0AAV7R100_PLEWA|nr:hypothetical protein NDU88_011778 [Pleurodeles waltl]